MEAIDKLVRDQQSGVTDAEGMMSRTRQRNQLAGQRQELSNGLSRLQQGVRDAARELASQQPGAAQKLRDALTEMDQADLDNHVQRTADWLRRGINPNSNGTEEQIAQGLTKLSQGLHAAEGEMGRGKPGQGHPGPHAASGEQVAALGQVERLRSRIKALTGPRSGAGRQDAGPGRGAQGQGSAGQQGRPGAQGSSGQRGGSQGQGSGSGNQAGDQWQAGGGAGQAAGTRSGPGTAGGDGRRDSGGQGGEVRFGGGGAEGFVGGNINTGNNRYGTSAQRQAPTDASGNPADSERSYEQGVRDLNQLRQMVQGDPQAQKEVAELSRQMQQLDPKRFPGNPAMVERMHEEVLNAVDRLELQLQRDTAGSEARSGKPAAVPAGYQDAVAEYYRRLSKKP